MMDATDVKALEEGDNIQTKNDYELTVRRWENEGGRNYLVYTLAGEEIRISYDKACLKCIKYDWELVGDEITNDFAEGEVYDNGEDTIEITGVSRSGRVVHFDDGGYELQRRRDNLAERLEENGFAKAGGGKKEFVTDGGEADIRTDAQKIEMARHFEEFEAEYRGDDVPREIVYEDDDCVITADGTGQEITEWASHFSVDPGELLRSFHDLADQKMWDEDTNRIFEQRDPVVFDKFE